MNNVNLHCTSIGRFVAVHITTGLPQPSGAGIAGSPGAAAG
jgi:hypothetical protein